MQVHKLCYANAMQNYANKTKLNKTKIKYKVKYILSVCLTIWRSGSYILNFNAD